MTKRTISVYQPFITVGTIGAPHHGKTTLLATILMVQSQHGRANERLYRADLEGLISHDKPGKVIMAEYESVRGGRPYKHIDCPGSDEYTENMVANMAKMDVAILVVSVDDSLPRETHEHVRLAAEAGIGSIVVYMNKCDVVDDPDMQDYVEQDVRALLNEHGFDGANVSVIRGSALYAREYYDTYEWGDSIRQLMVALDEMDH